MQRLMECFQKRQFTEGWHYIMKNIKDIGSHNFLALQLLFCYLKTLQITTKLMK